MSYCLAQEQCWLACQIASVAHLKSSVSSAASSWSMQAFPRRKVSLLTSAKPLERCPDRSEDGRRMQPHQAGISYWDVAQQALLEHKTHLRRAPVSLLPSLWL